MSRSVITVQGLGDRASFGDVLVACTDKDVRGEIVRITPESATVLLEGSGGQVSVGMPMKCLGPRRIAPDNTWLGRVIDADAQPLDSRPLLSGTSFVTLDAAPPKATERRGFGPRLRTGHHVFNTILPIARGQRLGLFAGSGVGKSTLIGTFAADLEADIIIIALVGERGREVNQFIEQILGPRGLRRSVVVVATSDRSAPERRRAAFTAMTIAEHFRDQGAHVLLMIDSLTRLAEAHREIASAAGESMALRGYPASMVQLLSELTERAGPGVEGQGDITSIMTVLVAGSDMEEPVADTLRGLLDGHVTLTRKIAEAGRFPAVDILQSVSRSLPEAASSVENAAIEEVRAILSTLESSEMMVRSGLYAAGSDPVLDDALGRADALTTFLFQRTNEPIAESFATLASILMEKAAVETGEE